MPLLTTEQVLALAPDAASAKAGSALAALRKWSNTGRVLRLKGRGVPRPDGSKGDQYIALKIVLPQKPDAELERFIAQWQPAADSPRHSMGV